MTENKNAKTPTDDGQPMAWRWKERINSDFDSWVITSSEPPPYTIEQQPLYTSPPKRDLTCVCGAVWEGEMMVHPPRKREWVGLTQEEFDAVVPYCHNEFDLKEFKDFACAIEAKLKEKNT